MQVDLDMDEAPMFINYARLVRNKARRDNQEGRPL